MTAPFIGTAGWSIPAAGRACFPEAASLLQRYAGRLGAVEINSSFYRPHRPATYRRWAASVPPGFRFAVKVPRTITHERRLADAADLLAAFLAEARELGATLGPLLLQMPPSLVFDPAVAGGFLQALRERFAGDVACEPRHPSWFSGEAEALLGAHRVARVAADPVPKGCPPAAGAPGGWRGLAYHRLHGTPRIYYSDYPPAALARIEAALRAEPGPGWCIFDNTALGHATGNALDLSARF